MRRLAKMAGVALGVALVLGSVQSSVADEGYDELDRFPGQGIPDIAAALNSNNTNTWVVPQQRGVTYLERAKQWMRTPTLQSVAYNRNTQFFLDRNCTRTPPGAPVGASRFREYWADVVLANRATSLDSPRRYGYTQSFVVRAMAFGNVPVEATVALEQPRNARGVVIPMTLKQGFVGNYCPALSGYDPPPPPGATRYMPAEAKGGLRVRVDQLVVDGVSMSLANCGADDARLSLTSRDFLSWRVPTEEWPSTAKEVVLRTSYFTAPTGGLLFGTLDIPSFTGCVTDAGEDLSALLTATVSGEANAVQIRTEALESDGARDPDDPDFGYCPLIRDCADRFPVPEVPTSPPS